MGIGDTIRVIQPGRRRLKIFVDFWNVLIHARSRVDAFNIDVNWDVLSQQILSETKQGFHDESIGDIAGCYIFGSYNKSNSREFKDIEKILDTHGSKSGLFFDFSERTKKQTTIKCDSCGNGIKQTSESGVDIKLTVEMIKHAFMREHDYIALVSGDRDFIPLLSYLKDLGQRVLHVAPNELNRDMRAVTWAQFGLEDRYPYISTINCNEYIILTTKTQRKQENAILEILKSENYKLIDITNVESISNKDLAFILKNQSIYFKSKKDLSGSTYGYNQFSDKIDVLRQKLKDGEIYGDFPRVIKNGVSEVYFSNERWIRMYDIADNGRWASLVK